MADPVAAAKAAALAGEAERLGRCNLATARNLLQRATRGAASAMAHATLARVLVAAGDSDAALRELGRALKLDPAAYAVHLEKAAIYGEPGRGKDQAQAYAAALQLLPPAVVTSPDARPLLERAQRAVLANKAELGRFLDERHAGLRSGLSARVLGRFDESLDISLGRKPLHVQKPAMFHAQGLPAIAFSNVRISPGPQRSKPAPRRSAPNSRPCSPRTTAASSRT